MKFFVIALLSGLLFLSTAAQEPSPTVEETPDPEAVEEALRLEKEAFENAVNTADPIAKAKALEEFAAVYPESENRIAALELLAGTRVEIGQKKLNENDVEAGLEYFRLSAREVPVPVSDRLFAAIYLQMPTNLFFMGHREAAYEIAGIIEEKAAGSTRQLLGLSTFYLGVEDSGSAKRLALKALDIDPELPSAYQTLGLACRMGFDLEASVEAYEKALELDPGSRVTRRSLAEMKRAVGRSDEALALYRGLVEEDGNDLNARTGLALALYDAGFVAEADAEFRQLIEANPRNLPLLVGAAYWHAAKGSGQTAVELANKALEVEPRYTWAYIALARGLLKNGDPFGAERALLSGIRYGNFPTLRYELAAVRFSAGLYREAADELLPYFRAENGRVSTRLGGRVVRTEDSFPELIAYERQASIFQPASAEDPEAAEKMKHLLAFVQALEGGASDTADAVSAADRFIEGRDNMRTHRQLFAAGRLLEKRVAYSKVLILSREAVSGVEDALKVPNPAAAVLAEELYESRKIAIARGTVIVVPEVPERTLSNILRGRIEELAGWALFEQGDPEGATVRLKRALSVLPADSAWWRSALWRQGTIEESLGRDEEALESYIKSYAGGEPNEAKKIVVETVYRRVHGDLEGLEARLEVPAAKDAEFNTAAITRPQPSPAARQQNAASRIPEVVPIADGPPVSDPKPTPVPETRREDAGAAADDARRQDLAASEDKPAETNDDRPADTEIPARTEEMKGDPVKGADDEEAGKPAEADRDPDGKGTTERPDRQGESRTGESRPRIVTDPRAGTGDEAPVCSIALSEESVSIDSEGGSVGILAGIEGRTGIFSIRGSSLDPEHIGVSAESGLEEYAGKGYFVIRTISGIPGKYRALFESPCGNREVKVEVR